MFGISQSGATGFVPNMFVAQKKLNKAVSATANITTGLEDMKKHSEELNRASSQQKDKSNQKSLQTEKAIVSNGNILGCNESSEIESATATLTQLLFKWIVSYLSMGRLA